MKKISLIVMSCIIACGLLANHGIVKGGEMSPKVEDTVSIDKKITDSQWLSKTVMAGRGKLKQKLIEACRFAQREK